MIANLQQTVDFYSVVLGFEIKMSSPEWAYLIKGNCEIMFQPAKTLLKEFPELTTAKMNEWLKQFTYRIDIHWSLLIVAGSLTLIVALLVVGFQAIKAAATNPVNALRNE